MERKIVIAGGSGALGSLLINAWKDEEVDLVVLTRQRKAQEGRVRYVWWDARSPGQWEQEVEGSALVINLVGKSVNCRYTGKNKAEIIRSRVDATRILGEVIGRLKRPPELWINAGSAAIYGNAGLVVKTEDDMAFGKGFSPEVCKQWEQAFFSAETPQTRKVFLRIGMVLQHGRGVLKPFVNLARFGLGGTIGSGEQYMTWLHEVDFVRLIAWIVEHQQVQGVIHASSPYPVNNRDFMKAIRTALGVPFGFPHYEWSTKFGAWLIGTESELVLSGRRVVSNVLQEEGFVFRYPEIQEALRQLSIK
ncbi:NAD-dependent epimerase [Parapedobacter defluvii]|uniref:NAD-dependent epimerase n=1 Tax=Parapedobacter defluvii TaxID=2045106 RepID=A0ABQ1KVZ8_9SPHI|nr:TIGR01777 family oxidoreductase [Parapedobacter defluvii]RQP14263.1 MAG: TIGR01777 family protein [Parapedobacter sp.]GGC12671.1 NAD-dependent epimerase [Parapedobacter defluvii]